MVIRSVKTTHVKENWIERLRDEKRPSTCEGKLNFDRKAKMGHRLKDVQVLWKRRPSAKISICKANRKKGDEIKEIGGERGWRRGIQDDSTCLNT